ncbi:hypothetical protein KOR34_18030 [Posidoniimonas corsicana]|uniref:Activator of Hsp90 ATPase homologue 1/2-like C-terminal domain-containing protein n=1 Tax=Posidoniimonas corsicana TaxID=1938618 RepID=A0A5C5VE22_9BACT|nr:SRPBCC domain-containing protein [Posidoniimonas corsicana]TWT36858.1 hypothetical protein KOR34_18030 [Posidoniimonas corsicana]
MKPAAVNTPSSTTVEVARSFDAPVESVWKTFTEPDMVCRWMLGPPGWSMPVCEFDFRVGGRYENRFRNEEDGMEFGLFGEFREIEPLARIVQDERHTLAVPDDNEVRESVVTLTFEEQDGRTNVVTLIEYASPQERDAALATGMTAAMEMGYGVIDELVAR